MVDLDVTTTQHNSMWLSADERGCTLYPAYKVFKAKVECLPTPEAITVLPDQAWTALQLLLEHTRQLRLQEPALESLTDEAPIPLSLHYQWGMDGSSGHSQYKQAGVRQDDHMFDRHSCLCSCRRSAVPWSGGMRRPTPPASAGLPFPTSEGDKGPN